MSITREKLNELAGYVADMINDESESFISKQDAEAFAHALLKAVEAEMEVVAYQSTRNGFICKENKNPEYNTSLIALPLIEGERE